MAITIFTVNNTSKQIQNFDMNWLPYWIYAYEKWSHMIDFHLIFFPDHQYPSLATQMIFLSSLEQYFLINYATNTLRPRQNGRHFPDDIFKCIFLNENVWIAINISPKFVLKGQLNNISTLVQTMAWCRPGDTPLSEPLMASLLTRICVTRPQVNRNCLTDESRHPAVSDIWGPIQSIYVIKPEGTHHGRVHLSVW